MFNEITLYLESAVVTRFNCIRKDRLSECLTSLVEKHSGTNNKGLILFTLWVDCVQTLGKENKEVVIKPLKLSLAVSSCLAKSSNVKMANAGTVRIFWVLTIIHYVAMEMPVPNNIQNSFDIFVDGISSTLRRFQNVLVTDVTVLDFTSSSITKSRFCSHHQPITRYTDSSKVRFPLENTTLGRALPSKHYSVHRNLYLLNVTASTFKKIAQFIYKVNSYGYPHRDYFIFVGHSDLVEQIFELEASRSVKYKLGFNGEALYGPENTSAPQALEKVNINGRKFKVQGPNIPLCLTLYKNGSISGGTHYMVLTTIAKK